MTETSEAHQSSMASQLFLRYARSNLPEMQLLFRSGKLSPNYGNWDNVIRHSLVQAAATEVITNLLALPVEQGHALQKAALCHDWRQRIDKDHEEFSEQEIQVADEFVKRVAPDPLLMEATEQGFNKQILDGEATLLQKLQFYIDDVTRNDDIVLAEERITDAEKRKPELNDDTALTTRLGGGYWDVERRAVQLVERELYDLLRSKGIPIEKQEDIPQLLKKEIEKLVNSNKETQSAIKVTTYSQKEAERPDKQNEDAAAVLENDDTLVVFIGDGASSLGSITQTGGKGTISGLFAVSQAKKGIEENFTTESSSRELLLHANEEVARGLREKGINPQLSATEELPQAVASAVRIDKKAKTVDLAQAGDIACIIIKSDGTTELAIPLDDLMYDKQAILLAVSIAREKGISLKEALKAEEAGALMLKSRMTTNNDTYGRGYGALNGDPNLSHYIQTKTYPLSEVRKIILLTDGMFLPTQRFEEEPHWQEMAAIVDKDGLERLYQKVFSLKSSDTTLNAYPRFKNYDDATGIVIEI